jgi:MerR family transcriptional regulator, redox-sensitive transcriptional activator SoxR
MDQVGIGEIARRAGVATSTIRYYERIGLLPRSQRVSGKRRYDDDILQKLGVIRLAQHAGFTIAEIQTLVHEFPVNTPPSKRWEVLAGDKIAELEAMMQRIQTMKTILETTLNCACDKLEDCAEQSYSQTDTASVAPGC